MNKTKVQCNTYIANKNLKSIKLKLDPHSFLYYVYFNLLTRPITVINLYFTKNDKILNI